MMRKLKASQRRGQSGFTLAEMTVSLIILVQVIGVALLLFQFNARVTRTQTRLAEMQQSLRVGHNEILRPLRMTGRGGLPITGPTGPVGGPNTPPFRVALDIANNVSAATATIAPNYVGASPTAMLGTDILTVRGNFSTPQYYGAGVVLDDIPLLANSGTLVINRVTPQIPDQDLSALNNAIDEEVPEALLIYSGSPGEQYAVVELDPAGSASGANSVTVAFTIRGNARANAYRALWTNDAAERFPVVDGSDVYVTILEEYRFYVRNDSASLTPLDVRPRLSRARLLPNTGIPHGKPPLSAAAATRALATDIADDIIDLQVAVAFDTPNAPAMPGAAGIDRAIFESANGADDDWLFNSPDDDVTDALWNDADPANVPPAFYVRISTLARTAGRDQEYEGPEQGFIEDHDYTGNVTINSDAGRKYRRRSLQTIVKLRNLG